ncbi:MAG: alpha/beta fold hydrolase [Pseudomonadota bacterium]
MDQATETPEPRRDLDSVFHSSVARFTGGLSPAALSTAILDWGLHLAGSPMRQAELWHHAWTNAIWASAPLPLSMVEDKRFRSGNWVYPPFAQYRHWFQLTESWWSHATDPIDGVNPTHQRIVAFAARQMLDMLSPANTALSNPDVQFQTWRTGGRNLVDGLSNWLVDANRLMTTGALNNPAFTVGKTLAVTEGDVVYRNTLIELIRYRPTQRHVYREPILIVPAWIMKYYILDLSPSNSLVAWLRDQGFEVYVISWKNPDADDAELGLEDYLELGLGAALDAIAPTAESRVHAVGYCLGGTLLSASVAACARDGDPRIATVTLLAAQVDFTEPGELSLFINESQVAFLEDMMATQGYMRADQMAGAFRMLRSNDLIWSRVIRHYLLGERTQMNELMAWNADATRMPARMHSEYLRQMFLENRLAKGQFKVGGRPIALTDISVPIFAVATEKDHVSPWRSVYKIGLLTDTDVTFCLTAGGHNGGIVSEPGHPRRHHRIGLKSEGNLFVSADQWYETTSEIAGSWWPSWADWLKARSEGCRFVTSAPDQSLGPAPGTYVFQ